MGHVPRQWEFRVLRSALGLYCTVQRVTRSSSFEQELPWKLVKLLHLKKFALQFYSCIPQCQQLQSSSPTSNSIKTHSTVFAMLHTCRRMDRYGTAKRRSSAILVTQVPKRHLVTQNTWKNRTTRIAHV